MSEVLLKELSNSDIDWMLAMGNREEIAANAVLIHQGQPVHALHILLEGALSVSIAQTSQNPLGRAFAALEGGEIVGREIARLASGEIVGEIPFLESYLPSTTVTALKNSLVLSIPRRQLVTKLQQDISFAAHLYRASAILLADRLDKLLNQLDRSTVVLSKPELREILFVFAELHDSDIDWLISAGKVNPVTANSILVQADRPVEFLHILLDGKMTLSVATGRENPLSHAFSNLEETTVKEREFVNLSRGDIVGETPFVEAPPPSVTVRAVEDSLVLSIPRWRLAAKLLHDTSFAARFYRVLAALLADKQQTIVARLGYGRVNYSGQPLDETTNYENELNANFLEQVTLAGTRFDWLLKRIQANHGTSISPD